MWNAAVTIFGISIMFGGVLILSALFPDPTKKERVQARYTPVGIDQRTGDIIMKKDIDYYA